MVYPVGQAAVHDARHEHEFAPLPAQLIPTQLRMPLEGAAQVNDAPTPVTTCPEGHADGNNPSLAQGTVPPVIEPVMKRFPPTVNFSLGVFVPMPTLPLATSNPFGALLVFKINPPAFVCPAFPIFKGAETLLLGGLDPGSVQAKTKKLTINMVAIMLKINIRF
jgi:hypothetical protein